MSPRICRGAAGNFFEKRGKKWRMEDGELRIRETSSEERAS
jgi:hypothetical protein